MTSRIIVKNLPKKITEEKFRAHFTKTGDVTDVTLKFTKDGKFRQFGFIGYKTADSSSKAIEYFNNTFIDASKIVVESCKPLNDPERGRPWSKYSKESSSYQLKHGAKKEEPKKPTKKEEKASKKEKAKSNLDNLLGDELKNDDQFKEFLEANKAIKSTDAIWKNDFAVPEPEKASFDNKNDINFKEEAEPAQSKSKNKKKSKEVEVGLDNEERDKEKTATATTTEEDQATKNTETRNKKEELTATTNDEDEEDFENGRLFLRNLCYTCKEEELEELFKSYGPLVEVNIPIDGFSKKPKGFAYITCMFPEKALKAFQTLDGTIFQGRMLHIMPGKGKKHEADPSNSSTTDGGANSKFKKDRDAEQKKQAQSNRGNWNALFVNKDAVANLMAAKYNVDKQQLFDVHSSTNNNNNSSNKEASVAVKLAVGETQLVNEMRNFLVRNGVKVDAFSSGTSATARSKNTFLVKNLPGHTTEEQLRELFTQQLKVNGEIRRLIVPEYGLAAIVEFAERQEARDAFKKIAYRKFKNIPLYLEWAPQDVFDVDVEEKNRLDAEHAAAETRQQQEKKVEAGGGTLKEQEKGENRAGEREEVEKEEFDDSACEPDSTLFVKNLNFDTIESDLSAMFSKIGKCKATVARKISPKKESLSMGYGFVKFLLAADAKRALKKLQGAMLDGHMLELKFSNRTVNDNQSSNNNNNNNANNRNKTVNFDKSSKIMVRNIPFEAKAREIEELFRVFGELKYVRLPKKIDGAHRGFGFVDFVTINDAKRAFEALSHSTHLFGRRLVLEWAAPEQSQDVEILRLKEEMLSGPTAKKLKKSKILDDLGGEDESYGKMEH